MSIHDYTVIGDRGFGLTKVELFSILAMQAVIQKDMFDNMSQQEEIANTSVGFAKALLDAIHRDKEDINLIEVRANREELDK